MLAVSIRRWAQTGKATLAVLLSPTLVYRVHSLMMFAGTLGAQQRLLDQIFPLLERCPLPDLF